MQKQYAQPLIIGMLAGIGVGGYIYYQSADPTKSLALGGFAFLLLFWVVLRGNNLAEKKQRRGQQSSSKSNDAS